MMAPLFRAAALFIFAQGCCGPAYADTQNPVDALLSESRELLQSTPEKALVPFTKLQTMRDSFTPAQNQRYHALYAKYLGFQGRHEERIELVKSIIGQTTAPALRAALLYDLVDGNRALGHYGSALQAMNESVLLLPSLDSTNAKILVLSGAVSLLTTLRAYEEGLALAERMIALDASDSASLAQCHGLASKIELNFKLGNSQLARSLVPQTVVVCDAGKEHMASLIVKSYMAIDLIDTGRYTDGIAASQPLVQQFQTVGTGSNWLAAVEEALARAYLKTGNFELAERYGTQAYKRAQSVKDLDWQERTSETMATIKSAQGQLAQANAYYATNLALKKLVLNDQQQKNLAYQRVKFDTQDKASQLALLEQKNKNLNTEKALQHGKYQNLVLLLTLGLIAFTILGVWLVRALLEKNTFRKTAQIDGLTQVSNRVHFSECAQKAFKYKNSMVSLVLFDMDFFKKINDTYGHATGDWVLNAVCHTVRRRLPKNAFLGRMGGEEFAVCLPTFSAEEAQAVAERCRKAIAVVDTRHSGFNFQMTASFGIATRTAKGAFSFEQALAAADKALYFSKNGGRNRVTVYQHSDAFQP